MRKLSILCILLTVFLTGCKNLHHQDSESIKVYESFIDAVVSNKGIESKIIPFEYKMNVFKQKDDYKYEIELYNPQVAMYDIQAIAVDQNMDSNTNVYPCIGILGDDANSQSNMIPYQARGEKGFVKMIILDAISPKKQFTVNVMVTWKDSTLQNQSRVFFNCNYVQEKGDTAIGEKTTSDAGKANVD